ncbi:acyltransferase [Palleniella muris]|uniref:Acyltransferase n=1 Tax=Palleniella muris TaxID=3038145 RepID=A0AC61QN24_9BACT|nr:acyltransferase [Palleniella muris]TGX80758.1 acyltransferase [Palleniella muris]
MHNEFDEIRPFGKGEVRPAVESLLNDRQFMTMLRGFIPLPKGVIRFLLRTMFIGVNTTLDFQRRYMRRVVNYTLKKSTDGCTFSGHPLPVKDRHHTYISNHRDIVLDSAILSYELFKNGYDTTVEIGIGDNLLIYPWIRTLVKLNKAFTVKRGLSPRQLLESSMLMSRYIHHAIKDKGENIWLAQREGRAKDSDDRTQESVLKMLGYGGSLDELNIVPLTISYEFDPCDYLKAKEFQLKRDNPAYKKSKQDDLENMKVGIMGYKGRVHYECAPCINEWLGEYDGLTKADFYMEVARRMDNAIHQGYRIYPNNYIALDLLNGNRDNADNYTAADEKRFEDYLKRQLSKIDIPNKDEAFLRERMLTMYANPLRNKMASENEDDGA